MEFIAFSKKNHAEKEQKDFWQGAFIADNTDTLRHHSMLNTMRSVLNNFKFASVLSIGDNRGRDAAWAKSITGGYTVASDLNADKLKKAVELGYIDAAVDVDVENINFCDDEFDFVICKEAFHHFPRPFLGFYEMLRVAKVGVIIFEPVDCKHHKCLEIYPDNGYHDSYESVGNYKYQISPREFLKAAWAVGCEQVIMKGFNDPLESGMNFEEYQNKRKYLDSLGVEGNRQFNLMAICILKKFISISVDTDSKVFLKPINPFV